MDDKKWLVKVDVETGTILLGFASENGWNSLEFRQLEARRFAKDLNRAINELENKLATIAYHAAMGD